jgi:hypothetical protein
MKESIKEVLKFNSDKFLQDVSYCKEIVVMTHTTDSCFKISKRELLRRAESCTINYSMSVSGKLTMFVS